MLLQFVFLAMIYVYYMELADRQMQDLHTTSTHMAVRQYLPSTITHAFTDALAHACLCQVGGVIGGSLWDAVGELLGGCKEAAGRLLGGCRHVAGKHLQSC